MTQRVMRERERERERDIKRTEGNKVRTLVTKISEVSCCDIKLKLIVKRNDSRGKPLTVLYSYLASKGKPN
jgi:hypothetical protein